MLRSLVLTCAILAVFGWVAVPPAFRRAATRTATETTTTLFMDIEVDEDGVGYIPLNKDKRMPSERIPMRIPNRAIIRGDHKRMMEKVKAHRKVVFIPPQCEAIIKGLAINKQGVWAIFDIRDVGAYAVQVSTNAKDMCMSLEFLALANAMIPGKKLGREIIHPEAINMMSVLMAEKNITQGEGTSESAKIIDWVETNAGDRYTPGDVSNLYRRYNHTPDVMLGDVVLTPPGALYILGRGIDDMGKGVGDFILPCLPEFLQKVGVKGKIDRAKVNFVCILLALQHGSRFIVWGSRIKHSHLFHTMGEACVRYDGFWSRETLQSRRWDMQYYLTQQVEKLKIEKYLSSSDELLDDEETMRVLLKVLEPLRDEDIVNNYEELGLDDMLKEEMQKTFSDKLRESSKVKASKLLRKISAEAWVEDVKSMNRTVEDIERCRMCLINPYGAPQNIRDSATSKDAMLLKKNGYRIARSAI